MSTFSDSEDDLYLDIKDIIYRDNVRGKYRRTYDPENNGTNGILEIEIYGIKMEKL